MNFKDIKLIAFDMDGTLLNDKHKVSPLFYKHYYTLKAKGVHFVAASGRQLQSIRNTLEPIKDEINIIAENGGVLQYNQNTETLLKLENAQVKKCIDCLRKIKNCYIVLCGKKAAYIEETDPEFLKIFKNYYHEVIHVNDLKEVTNDDFLKIAVFHFESSENYILPFVNELGHFVKLIVSAKNWLDISPFNSNKGYALERLQKKLGISTKQTMAFGDYNNDLEMLRLAHYSYAMANAHPNVKAVANYQTKSNNEQGVETVLDLMIRNS